MLATFGKCKLCDSKLVILYSWICCVNLCNFQSHWRCWKGSPIIVHPVMKCCPIHRKPSLLDFEFIRECMTINKMCPKFHFLTKIEIRMTYLVLFVLLSYKTAWILYFNNYYSFISIFVIYFDIRLVPQGIDLVVPF